MTNHEYIHTYIYIFIIIIIIIIIYLGFHILITITIIFLGNQWEPTICHLLMLFSALPGSCSIPKLGFKSLLSISFYSCSIYINIYIYCIYIYCIYIYCIYIYILYIAYRFLMYSRFHGSGRPGPGTKLDSSKLDAPSFSSKSPKAVPVVKAAPPSRNTRQPQVAVTHPPLQWGNISHHPVSNMLNGYWKSGWWYTYPSEKSWTSSVGMIIYSQYMEKNVPNHQPAMYYPVLAFLLV